MSKSLTVLLAIFAFFVIVCIITFSGIIGSYNSIVTLDEESNKAWGKVENAYQRRFDLIPNLMETAKGYLTFEKETLIAVTEARKQVTNIKVSSEEIAKNPMLQKQFLEAQQNLSSEISRLMVVVEKYPDLKGSQVMIQFMDEQAGTENRVAVERGRFQDAINGYNSKIRRFPHSIVAGMSGFEKRGYYKAEEGAEKAPKVKF